MTGRPLIAGLSPLAIAINAPVVGESVRTRRQLHAVELSGVPKPRSRRTTCDALCGTKTRLVTTVETTAKGDLVRVVVPWPPEVKPLRASGGVRCAECFAAAQPKRPRSTLTWEPKK